MSTANNIIKNFLYTNLYSPSNFFSKEFDEPTYLTFKIEFGNRLSSMYSYQNNNFNMVDNAARYKTNYDLMPAGLLDGSNDKFIDRPYYSAMSYLNDINESRRAKMLNEFISGLYDLQCNYQYCFTEILGIEKLFQIDPKRGSRLSNDTIIEISCDESLDMKILYLMNLYRKIAWDDTWQRWVLPDIMRYFNLIIYITEFRTFHVQYPYTPTNTKNNPNDVLLLSMLNNLTPTLSIECKMCEFDISDILNIQSLKSNKVRDYTTNKIRIKVKNSMDVQVYPMYLYGYLDDNLINGFNRTNFDTRAIPYHLEPIFETMTDVANNSILLPGPDTVHISNRAYYNKALNDMFQDSNGTLGNGWLNNALKWGTSYVSNKVEDYTNSLMNNNIGGLNISANEILNTIKSKDIVSVIGAIKKATMDTDSLYPTPTSFKDRPIDNQLFKSVLEGLTISQATNNDEKFLINAAKEALSNAELYNKINNMSREQLENMIKSSNMKDIAIEQSNNDRSKATDLDKKKQIMKFD